MTFNPLATCRKCKACLRGQDNICPSRQIISMQPRQGAFAEFVAIPEVNLVEVPDQIDLNQAALAEPIACGWHAAKLSQRGISIDLGAANALVIGGGAIGVSSTLSLKALGIPDVFSILCCCIPGLQIQERNLVTDRDIHLRGQTKGRVIFSDTTKYGEDIGKIVADIAQGEHVHTHNCKTKRW